MRRPGLMKLHLDVSGAPLRNKQNKRPAGGALRPVGEEICSHE
jgi:hypothetical protein